MESDRTLLREYLADRSEEAFARLVMNNLDLVHSAASRQLNGDADLARDAAQQTFCELARKAPQLQGYESLSGWLYSTSSHIASRLRRGEQRRVQRERKFAMDTNSEEPPVWSDVGPLLDAAMGELSPNDRDALLLRFFKSAPLQDVARHLGTTENAARMRVDRALEKLKGILAKNGVRCPTAALSGLLIANAVTAAPAGLPLLIAAGATAAAAGAGVSTGLPLLAHFMTTQTKIALATLAAAGVITGYLPMRAKNARLEQQLLALRSSIQQPTAPSSLEAGQVAVDGTEIERLRAQHSELLRLRGEVTRLRAAQAAPKSPPPMAPSVAAPAPAPLSEEELEQRMQAHALARMTTARTWGVAFYRHSAANGGKFPSEFALAAEHLPGDDSTGAAQQLDNPDFEILFSGAVSELESPEKTIVLRDKEPFDLRADGSAKRTYLFADGHTEVYRAKDGNFEDFENRFKPRFKSLRE